MKETLLTIKNLNKFFGEQQVLNDISLTLARGEMLFLLGASGCGKTTLLRAIAGFEQPTNGEIWLKERLIFGENCNLTTPSRLCGARGRTVPTSKCVSQYCLWLGKW